MLAILILCTFQAISQDIQKIKVQITPWYQNKPAAVSISFDDANYTQYTSAFAVLERFKIKGTFSIVGEWVNEQPGYSSEPGSFEIKKMGWPQFLELFNHGHELAAHGYFHEKYNKQQPVPDLVMEMQKIKLLIESKTNSTVFTLNYPYSYASGNIPEAAREAGFLFGRTGLDTINPSTPPNMYLLASKAILSNDIPDSSMFREWIDQSKGNWLILMYHHFFQQDSKEMEIMRMHDVKNSYSLPPEALEKQIKVIVDAGYWIAPVSEIGRYIVQRDNTVLRCHSSKKKIFIYTITNLDKNIYNRPLTLEVDLPWKRVKIQGSLDDGIFETRNNKLFINVLPEEELILSKK